MCRLGIGSCLLLSTALLVGCVDRKAPTAPSTRPLASAAAADGGPLIALSRPNAGGTCTTGFNTFGTWPTDETDDPCIVGNPVHPHSIIADWPQSPLHGG